MTAYYNEIDPFAAQWLRELIKAGHIADGEVDERDIRDVRPVDLKGFTQCHFFAGIGVWSHSLRAAGWGDGRPVWTGSCPCQPFSAAGRGGGFADERHLWPAFNHLIRERNPSVVFGEQVASKDGLAWLDLVQTDMEAARYAFGKVDLCAAGFGAPHIRQRLFWVAYADYPRSQGWDVRGDSAGQRSAGPSSVAGGVADAQHDDGRSDVPRWGQDQRTFDEWLGSTVRMADTMPAGRPEGWTGAGDGSPASSGSYSRPDPVNGFWGASDWLYCRDARWRPVEPGTFPLVNGAAARVGRLRGYGNAIVAQAATAFIEAVM